MPVKSKVGTKVLTALVQSAVIIAFSIFLGQQYSRQLPDEWTYQTQMHSNVYWQDQLNQISEERNFFLHMFDTPSGSKFAQALFFDEFNSSVKDLISKELDIALEWTEPTIYRSEGGANSFVMGRGQNVTIKSDIGDHGLTINVQTGDKKIIDRLEVLLESNRIEQLIAVTLEAFHEKTHAKTFFEIKKQRKKWQANLKFLEARLAWFDHNLEFASLQDKQANKFRNDLVLEIASFKVRLEKLATFSVNLSPLDSFYEVTAKTTLTKHAPANYAVFLSAMLGAFVSILVAAVQLRRRNF